MIVSFFLKKVLLISHIPNHMNVQPVILYQNQLTPDMYYEKLQNREKDERYIKKYIAAAREALTGDPRGIAPDGNKTIDLAACARATFDSDGLDAMAFWKPGTIAPGENDCFPCISSSSAWGH
jgi:hypothetical protein